MVSTQGQLKVDGRRIAVSNLDKVLYPGGHFTKARVIDYYVRISKYLLPHLKNRPVTLKRFPNGIYGEFFYEKDAPAFTPDWVKTFPVPRRERSGPDINYIMISDLPTLVWLANLANLEIHPFLHRAPRIDRPTWIVFDLDPGKGASILTCARVAFMLRDVFNELKLKSCVKVSGSKGLQLYVPLNTAATYQQTRAFAKAIAQLLAEREPKLIVAKMPKAFRAHKVFIDWSQNDDYKTTVSVYSLRANYHRPYVSVPVEWNELKRAIEHKDPDQLYFTPEQTLERVEQRGDLFKDVLTMKQKLPREVAPRSTGGPRRMKSGSVTKARTREISRSRQGGRRRFIVEKHKRETTLLLEIGDAVRVWTISGDLPTRARQTRVAQIEANRSVNYFNKRFDAKGKNSPVDAGTYELVEGSYEGDFHRVYLSGKNTKGEWTIKRDGNKWTIAKSANAGA